MTIHVCGSDGQLIGEFEEQDFIAAVFASRLPADCYYWQEGMADWRPISEYRALAKTQRISFTPPMKRTVRINMDSVNADDVTPQSERQGFFARIRDFLTGKR